MRRFSGTKTLVLTILLALALLVRLLTFERSLPVADYADELNMYMLGLAWRGGDLAAAYGAPAVQERFAHYPPLYVAIEAVAQNVVDAASGGAWKPVGAYLYLLRLLSIIAGVITTLFVALAAWELGGVTAGWLAGLAWAIIPAIYETSDLAIPDSLVYPACALALALAILAWRRASPRWLFASLLAGIAAIYLKYTPVYALLPWGVVTLLLLWRQPRRMIPWMLAQGVITAAAAAYLLFGYGALDLNNGEGRAFRTQGVALIDGARLWNNAGYALIPLGGWLLAGTAVLALVACLRSRRRVPLGWTALLLVYTAAGLLTSAATSSIDSVLGAIRHVLPAVIALIIIWALCAEQIRRALRLRVLRALLVIGLTLAISLPALAQTTALAARFRLPDSRLLLWRWSDASIPPDGMILTDIGSRMADVWNRPWRGYDGATSFAWWQETGYWLSEPETLAQRGMAYFVLDGLDRERLKGTAFDAFLARLTHLKTIPASAAGAQIDIYRILPPGHSADVAFGDQIRLVGYDLDVTDAVSGGKLVFRPYWQAAFTPTGNYSMFIHLSTPDTLVAQYDGTPVSAARLPPTWDDPDELLIGARASIDLNGVAPGDYTLSLGLYDFVSGARLPTRDGGDSFTQPLRVGEPEAAGE